MTNRTIVKRWRPDRVQRSHIHEAAPVLPPGHWQEFDPFLMLAEDWFQHGTFEEHPHRGIETVTYVISGKMGHYDNKSAHAGVLGPEDVQWMTAGKGVIHQEDPLPGEIVHSLQLWINLPRDKKLMDPQYQDLPSTEMPIYEDNGISVRVYSGATCGITAPTKNIVPIIMAEIRLDKDRTLNLDLPNDHNGFLYILEGEGLFGSPSEGGTEGEVLWLGPASNLNDTSGIVIRSTIPLRAMFYSGPPLGQPVVSYGPFVMNTREEIQQAIIDYNSGKFV